MRRSLYRVVLALGMLVPLWAGTQPAGGEAPHAQAYCMLSILSPGLLQRVVPGEPLTVRVRVHIPQFAVAGAHLHVQFTDATDNTTSQLPMELGQSREWQSDYSAEIDTTRRRQAFYYLSAQLTAGQAQCRDQVSFSIAVDQDLVGAVMERAIAGDGDLNTLAAYGDVYSFAQLEQRLTGLGLEYVDPDTGAPILDPLKYPLNLRPLIGAPAWLPASAPYAAQVAQIKGALKKLTWQVVGPKSLQPGSGPSLTVSPTVTTAPEAGVLVKVGHRVFHAATAPTESEKAADAASLFESTRDAVAQSPTYTNTPALENEYGGVGLEMRVGDGQGVYVGSQIDYPVAISQFMRRTFISITMPPPPSGAPAGPLKLVLRASPFSIGSCNYGADDANPSSERFKHGEPLSVYVRTIPVSWTLRPSDWDAPAQKIATVQTMTNTVRTYVFTLSAALSRASGGAGKGAPQAARLLIELRGNEDAPAWGGDWWKEHVYGGPCYNDYGQTSDGSASVIQQFPVFRRLTFPFAIIRPSSLDGANGGYDVVQGALDFGNTMVGDAEGPQAVTITNGGTGPLHITHIDDPDARTGFSIGGSTCAQPVAPGHSCALEVAFRPRQIGHAVGYLRVEDNAPDSPQMVWLDGSGVRGFLPSMTVDRSETSTQVPEHCTQLLPPKLKLAGWEPISDLQYPATLDGQVVEGHITTADAFFNHNTIDYNFFVYPDASERYLVATPGNFTTGDGYEFGRIEVEWERALGDKAGGKAAAGLPSWAWPTAGDRVHVVGNWIYDCGHKEEGFRSEIHPPRLVVTYRNAALGPFAGRYGRLGSYYDGDGHLTWATRADVFASSYGGDAINSEYGTTLITRLFGSKPPWWQPVNRQDYTFYIKAPPRPDPEAQLTYWECNHLVMGDCARHGLINADALVPGADPHAPEPILAAVKDGYNEYGYQVTLPFRMDGIQNPVSDLMAVGRTIWVGWTHIPARAEARLPHLRHYQVRVVAVTVRHRLNIVPGLSTDWQMWTYVNERAHNLLAGGYTDVLGEEFGTVDHDGERITLLRDAIFDVTLVDGQPLHVELRGVKNNGVGKLFNNDIAGSAEEYFSSAEAPGRHITRSRHDILAGDEDVISECRNNADPCFVVEYDVTTQ